MFVRRKEFKELKKRVINLEKSQKVSTYRFGEITIEELAKIGEKYSKKMDELPAATDSSHTSQ